MSFNRFRYDGEEKKMYDATNKKTSEYFLLPPLNKEHCLQENPRIMNQRGGVAMPRDMDWRFSYGPVDVESDLYNLQRVASRCPSKKFQPGSSSLNRMGTNGVDDGAFSIPSQLVNFPCRSFPTDDTRLSNPACNLRGTGMNRFEDLCLDPQYNVIMPGGKTNLSARMSAKDSYRMELDVPTIGN